MLTSIIILSICIIAAKGLKDCEDCMLITECPPAMRKVTFEKTPDTIRLLNNALCGYDGKIRMHKVCCFDFIIGTRSGGETENEVNTGDEIETHRNIKLLSGECGDMQGDRITGGTTAQLYEFPWLVLIKHKNHKRSDFNCGGTLINSRYVLTAAHCIKDRDIASVRIGEYNLSTDIDCVGHGENRDCAFNYQDIDVVESIHHQEFSRYPVYINDIGLLRLGRPANLTHRNSGLICLPITKALQEQDIVGERGLVAGWGITEKLRHSDVLLKVDIPMYSSASCIKFYNRNQRALQTAEQLKNTICAGERGRDSCRGDSGGPLMLEGEYSYTYKYIQFGIVSYGYSSECGSETPGVYTDVRKYMKWILDTIKP